MNLKQRRDIRRYLDFIEGKPMGYDNTNRGTLGKNDRKEKDTHPDYAGKLNVDGKDYWLSGWLKQGPTGKFFSLSVKPKDARTEREPGQDVDEDIPF